MPAPLFTNDYAPDGKAIREAARAAAGHRCVRCGHPFQCGLKRPDKGEWSDCDENCTHGGILRFNTDPAKFPWSSYDMGDRWDSGTLRKNLPPGTIIQAHWRILTVHHFDGNKANDAWFNLLALCQKCHLSFQTRVNPEIPYMFEHSTWLKPYVAGFYAMKYQGKLLTREQVMARLDELLAYECRVVEHRP